MSYWSAVPELCPCGGTACLRLEEGCDEPDDDGTKPRIIDWLFYECPKCGRRGAGSKEERQAADYFHQTNP